MIGGKDRCCYNDGPDATGKVNDTRRTDFYRGDLGELHRPLARVPTCAGTTRGA